MMFAASRSVVKVFVRGLRCRSRPGHCTALPQSLSAGGTYSLAALHTNSVVLKLQPFNLPDVGEAIETVEVKEWLTKPGNRLNMGDPVCEVQSDKSAVVVYSPLSGVVSQLMYKPGDVAHKGKPLIMIETDEESVKVKADQGTSNPSHTSAATGPSHTSTATGPSHASNMTSSEQDASLSHDKVLTTPAVRRIARENNIDLRTVSGTGKDGRVLREDVMRIVEAHTAPSPPPHPPQVKYSPPPPPPPPSPPPASGVDKAVAIKGFKSVMVRTMTASGQVPQFGYSDEVDVSKMVALHGVLKAELAKRGVKFSYMPVFVKALSLALLQYPILNSHVDEMCTVITYKSSHNIGIAMDTPEGLVVPNIKGVERKSIFEIAEEMNRLHTLGLKGQLAPSDITGGTFSLSNIGNVGGTYLRPLLLPPEVAIGGLGKIQVLPRFDDNGNVVKAHVIRVNWSADHRVIDGATVARFSNVWKSFVNNPATMVVDMR